ncbi:MAG: hypothetical protein Q8M94_18295 [Ignavibacteria bacterium]|nr:hypothetical protein [Ignavibacteria bacterium]
MEKVIKKTSTIAKQSDLEYWLTKTPQERLDALEFLRQQYIDSHKNIIPRLQRVVTKITLKK